MKETVNIDEIQHETLIYCRFETIIANLED